MTVGPTTWTDGVMKTCARCGETKPLSGFTKHSRCAFGVRATCRVCLRPQLRETERRYRRSENGRKKMAAKKRLAMYGISGEQYEEMLVRQDNKCAICRRPPKTMALSVDHDHSTGSIRGLLCGNCNAAIGMLDDSPVLLGAAIAYLKEN